MQSRFGFLWVLTGALLGLSALVAGPVSSGLVDADAALPVASEDVPPAEARLEVIDGIDNRLPNPECAYPDNCSPPPPPPARCVFELIEQTSRVDGGFKTLVVFEVSGCESTNIEAVEGTPDKRTDNVRFSADSKLVSLTLSDRCPDPRTNVAVFVEAFDDGNEPVGLKQFFITPDPTQCPTPVPVECVVEVTDLGVENIRRGAEDILLAEAAISIRVSGCLYGSIEADRVLRGGDDTVRFTDSPHQEVAAFGCRFEDGSWRRNGPNPVGAYTIRVLGADDALLPGGSATYRIDIEDTDCEAAGATLP